MNSLRMLAELATLTPVVVLHANHANELDDMSRTPSPNWQTLASLLLNQAVLLAGVNDSADAQAALCERLIDLRVDAILPAPTRSCGGGGPLRSSDRRSGDEIVEEMRARLPGYAVPRYVQEVAGAAVN